MSLLKKLLIGLLLLILVAVGSTFFMSDNFRVYHTQVVKASPEAVFNQLNTIKNWNNWSYWNSLDPKMTMTFNDIPSGEGAGYSWKSEKKDVGNGSLVIKKSDPNAYIKLDLDFNGEGNAWSEYILKPVAGGTEVTSAMNMDTKGVFMKLMSRTMMRTGMKKAFKTSMDNMEKYLAEHPDVPAPTPIVPDSAKL
jgi:uncharacterized protein YndB with AHSA1/START domain